MASSVCGQEIRIEQIKRSISCSLSVHAKNLYYVRENIQRSVFLQGLSMSKNILQGSVCCACVYFNHLKQHFVVFLPQSDSFRIILWDSLTSNGEDDTPVIDTVPPAGLVQDDISLVACPAPSCNTSVQSLAHRLLCTLSLCQWHW